MSKKYLIALDEGTTSARAVLFDIAENEIVAVQNRPVKCLYPQTGWVEQDAEEIFAAQTGALAALLASTGATLASVAALGITNQRETIVVWEKSTGKPICNAISWQCRRTAPVCAALKDKTVFVQDKTGLMIDAYFSATKIAWILDNVEGARERAGRGELLAGTIDTYLIFRLTGGKRHITDASNAARTMLFNINTLKWDNELLQLFNVPRNILPEVTDSAGRLAVAEFDGGKVEICGIAGDQQAALFGQACFDKGDAKNTYGTGCFMLANVGDKPVISFNNLITTVAWQIGGKAFYAIEGSIFNAGSAVQWLRDSLGIIASASQTEEAALSVPDNGGVYFVPAFGGLGAPYWDNGASGTISGLTRGATKAHIIRATLEAMAYGTRDIMDYIRRDIGKISVLRVDGGASANNFLMQFQSDILNCRLERPANMESTALGAAYLAGLGCGIYNSTDQIKRSVDREFVPSMSEKQRDKLYRGWREAVGKSRYTRERLSEE